MDYDPMLAAMLSQPWSNNACRGYVIYAMENCGFSPNDIRRVVAELYEVFDIRSLEEAQQHFEESPYLTSGHFVQRYISGQRPALSWCWPLPCFKTFFDCMGGILCRRRSNMKVKSKRLFSEIGRSPSKISPPFFPRRSWKSTTARSSGGCLTCSANMPGSGGRPESSLL